MKVRELIEALKKLPQDKEIKIRDEYGLAQTPMCFAWENDFYYNTIVMLEKRPRDRDSKILLDLGAEVERELEPCGEIKAESLWDDPNPYSVLM